MLSQSFGDAVVTNEADIINTIEFHSSGNHFATGDRGGRIVIFRTAGEKAASTKINNNNSNTQIKQVKAWSPFFQFQSHEPEFDYLKSTEIEEKINCIRFGPDICNNLSMLSTNDKTIKLWKISQMYEYETTKNTSLFRNNYAISASNIISKFKLPVKSKDIPSTTYAASRKSYTDGHSYNINSIAINSNKEQFYSCDDLRINEWKFERSDVCFSKYIYIIHILYMYLICTSYMSYMYLIYVCYIYLVCIIYHITPCG